MSSTPSLNDHSTGLTTSQLHQFQTIPPWPPVLPLRAPVKGSLVDQPLHGVGVPAGRRIVHGRSAAPIAGLYRRLGPKGDQRCKDGPDRSVADNVRMVWGVNIGKLGNDEY